MRSHNIGSIPNPLMTHEFGADHSPNACNQCHTDKTAAWAVNTLQDWGMTGHLIEQELHLNRNATSDHAHN